MDTLFLCRHCYQFPYASQGEGYLDRMARKVNKLSKRLGAECFADLPGFGKPKHMHWKTHDRLMMAAIDGEDRMSNAVFAKFGHWL